jgi:3-isopropylmalate/(R)-2-methylmalate dehydratase large subunit
MLAGCLVLQKPAMMNVSISGRLMRSATAKDLALAVIAELGVAGGAGHVLEYTGEAVGALSMEERMTLCNLAAEAGATTAIIAADDITSAYLSGLPAQQDRKDWIASADADAAYVRTVRIDASRIEPLVTWGTNPRECASIYGDVPPGADEASLRYMGLTPGQKLRDIALDQAFIGSCTNARLSDLRDAAGVLRGRRVRIPTIVTPGSQAVKRAAEREGLHDVFQDAGALWTHASCGPCLGMSMGVVAPGTRCISSSNRNFPGRMGAGGRVHLASPRVVAASAVAGRIASPEELTS